MATTSSPRTQAAMAIPTACSTCVPTGELSEMMLYLAAP